MARPRKEYPRSRLMALRLTEEEFDKIDMTARAKGMTNSEYVRWVALFVARRTDDRVTAYFDRLLEKK